jgi:hypothetical protein
VAEPDLWTQGVVVGFAVATMLQILVSRAPATLTLPRRRRPQAYRVKGRRL